MATKGKTMNGQMEQLLLFDVQELQRSQEDTAIIRILTCLLGGGMMRYRVARFWRQGETTQDKAKFLREEQGVCGYFHGDESFWADARGIRIEVESPALSFARDLPWTKVARMMDEIVALWGQFDCGEEAERRERIENHIRRWRCRGWDGPAVGGYCGVDGTSAMEANGEYVYTYGCDCHIVGREDDEHWVAEIASDIPHLKGMRLRLHILDIAPPSSRRRAMGTGQRKEAT